MMSNDFESAFDRFLDRKEYDGAESALFAIVRAAFLAGWKSAGGDPLCRGEGLPGTPVKKF